MAEGDEEDEDLAAAIQMSLQQGRPADQAPEGAEFDTVLIKAGEVGLGIEVDHADERFMFVKALHSGAVETWNRLNPSRRISPGDRIVEVNGVRGDAHDMIAACMQSHVVRMRIARRTSPGAAPVAFGAVASAGAAAPSAPAAAAAEPPAMEAALLVAHTAATPSGSTSAPAPTAPASASPSTAAVGAPSSPSLVPPAATPPLAVVVPAPSATAAAVRPADAAAALLRSARLPDHVAMEEAMQAGAPVDARDEDGNTPLLALAAGATKGNCVRPLSALLRRRADVGARNILGETALQVAARQRNAVLVAQLLQSRADANAQDQFGEMALTESVLSQEVGIVRLLLRSRADVALAFPELQGVGAPTTSAEILELLQSVAAAPQEEREQPLAADASASVVEVPVGGDPNEAPSLDEVVQRLRGRELPAEPFAELPESPDAAGSDGAVLVVRLPTGRNFRLSIRRPDATVAQLRERVTSELRGYAARHGRGELRLFNRATFPPSEFGGEGDGRSLEDCGLGAGGQVAAQWGHIEVQRAPSSPARPPQQASFPRRAAAASSVTSASAAPAPAESPWTAHAGLQAPWDVADGVLLAPPVSSREGEGAAGDASAEGLVLIAWDTADGASTASWASGLAAALGSLSFRFQLPPAALHPRELLPAWSEGDPSPRAQALHHVAQDFARRSRLLRAAAVVGIGGAAAVALEYLAFFGDLAPPHAVLLPGAGPVAWPAKLGWPLAAEVLVVCGGCTAALAPLEALVAQLPAAAKVSYVMVSSAPSASTAPPPPIRATTDAGGGARPQAAGVAARAGGDPVAGAATELERERAKQQARARAAVAAARRSGPDREAEVDVAMVNALLERERSAAQLGADPPRGEEPGAVESAATPPRRAGGPITPAARAAAVRRAGARKLADAAAKPQGGCSADSLDSMPWPDVAASGVAIRKFLCGAALDVRAFVGRGQQ